MTEALTPFEALHRAVELAGGQSATARLLDKSQGAVWKWLNSSRRLPAECVLSMEAATGVSRHLLRPDIYPLPLPTEGEDPGEDCETVLERAVEPVPCHPGAGLQPNGGAGQ